NHAVLERLILVQLKLSLAHNAMATVTGVVEEFRACRIKRLFGFELRVKDWIAAGQTHHRGPPLSVLREIDWFSVRRGKEVAHVFVRGRMATHALARS